MTDVAAQKETIALLERAIVRLNEGWGEGALIEETNNVIKVCALGSLLPDEAFDEMDDWIELPEETTPATEEFGRGQYDHFRPWVSQPAFGASCHASRCSAVSELALAIKQDGDGWSSYDRENWQGNVELHFHSLKSGWDAAGLVVPREDLRAMAEHEADTILVYGWNDSQDSEEGAENVIRIFEQAISNIRASMEEPALV